MPHHAVESAMFGFGNQRHHVMQKCAFGFNNLADFRQMLIVYTGNHHRVDLNQNAFGNQHFQAFLLLFNQDFCGFYAFNAFIFPVNPRINLRADFRINAVNGDSDMIDIVLGQFLYRIGQRQDRSLIRTI